MTDQLTPIKENAVLQPKHIQQAIGNASADSVFREALLIQKNEELANLLKDALEEARNWKARAEAAEATNRQT